MTMKTTPTTQRPNQTGGALILTMIMSAIALALLAAAMSWSVSNTRLTYRSIQYNRSVAAAEAATEKVATQINRDFLYGGENLVAYNLNTYRQNTVPSSSDSPYWSTWEFNDANGHTGQTHVQRGLAVNYVELHSTYAGLKGFVTTYTIVSHARDTASSQDVTAGVLQQLQLANIPIFQFAMYSSGEMEISCGKPFDITGRVHSNGHLYVEPDSTLTFESSVTAVIDILFQRDPLDTRGTPPGTPAGSVVYVHPDQKASPVTALTLPIGTTNTPEAIREIIEPPPAGEDANSPIGRLRYYNQCDMVLVVSDAGISATSGYYNNFSTYIPTNELMTFVSTASSFKDAREGKTVKPIDINIGALTAWSQTNSNLRYSIIGSNLVLSSVYVLDRRALPGTSLGAVRVVNGLQLPTNGLTVATGRPLYVQGDYNQLNAANLGTTNTSTTRPASLVADAITILSDAWQDGNSASMQGAKPTTVNAAFLTGSVDTTSGQYSGGMENFPRFLESWGSANPFTYNGSMVKMFPSLYATNVWNGINYAKHYYDPPARKWAYDANFDDPTKLPPKTPSLLHVIRSQWANVAPGQNVAP
jgi:Tfp pilus assembly protein PilX